jgi:hypothetical protein
LSFVVLYLGKIPPPTHIVCLSPTYIHTYLSILLLFYYPQWQFMKAEITAS